MPAIYCPSRFCEILLYHDKLKGTVKLDEIVTEVGLKINEEEIMTNQKKDKNYSLEQVKSTYGQLTQKAATE